MSEVSLEEFKKLDLRVAKVLDAEEIPGADKLWRLTIDVGFEKKQIVAGIKLFYSKEAILGRLIIIVNNLSAATIRGVESHGMLLAAKDGPVLSILTLDKEIPPGSAVS